MKTELEAMDLYCCKPGAESDSRLQGLCSASKCMAWRWGRTRSIEAERIPADSSGLTPSSGPWRQVPRKVGGGTEWARYEHIPQGYCGLAGQPDQQ